MKPRPRALPPQAFKCGICGIYFISKRAYAATDPVCNQCLDWASGILADHLCKFEPHPIGQS